MFPKVLIDVGSNAEEAEHTQPLTRLFPFYGKKPEPLSCKMLPYRKAPIVTVFPLMKRLHRHLSTLIFSASVWGGDSKVS